MPIPESLCCLLLNQLDVHPVLAVIRVSASAGAARFTDQSRALLDALERSNRKAWKALEVALAGEGLWSRLDRADVRALRAQIRTFLDAAPLPELTGKAEYRKRCLTELRQALGKGVLLGKLVAGDLADKTGHFAAYTDPSALLRAEKAALTRLGKEVQDAGFKALGWLLAQPAHGAESVVVVSARYFFRREVETDAELFRGLQFVAVEALGESQRDGFRGLDESLAAAADRLETALDEVAAELLEAVAVVQSEVQAAHDSVRAAHETAKAAHDSVQALVAEMRAQLATVLAKLDMADKPVQPEHSLSVRTDREREQVRELLKRIRTAPEAAQRELAGEAGKLQVAIGDFAGAAASFATAAVSAASDREKAEAYHNSYRARLEERDYAGAARDLKKAVHLDPGRFAPFPTDKYELTRVLGAGGFGVTFECKHALTEGPVAVKSLTDHNLDHDVGAVLREAHALDKLKHRAIIGLRDCGYADAANKRRPYLVMEYFDGQTLQQYVEEHGPLALADALPLARTLAEALAAAHGENVLHRDVKPANVMVRRAKTGWEVRLIDFGLAMRSSVLTGALSTARGDTVLGSSIAGTIDYAAPEQLGKLPGVKVGFPADVYGFAKTLCFALFQTTEPTMRHYKALPEATADLIGRCLSRDPGERPQSFAEVLNGLSGPPARAAARPDLFPPGPSKKPPGRPETIWPKGDDGDGPTRRRPPRTDGAERVPTIDTGTRVTHALLAFFLGTFGAHKFAQDNAANGGLRLLILLSCVGLYWNLFVGMVECVQYLMLSNEEYTRTYLVQKKNWF
ncbi:serine threonine protein kinase : Serine/Threonine protein kinase OS=Beggiatoa sp. SS GN=BGS_0589 PE=3 SV=1: Pkinase [Gemmataceae bacterium]|nr:serine threonine protein kinase : Serine/Threonine protein kinase OS=Beggiatoa sp. SS GN=BGS_0589 PE=3 SV=1: Pkinase [Gemmataceae bacterium]VTT99689.1 serine threonine protein kinase : Serine/Threonine protein kinase OS=Beggiatoa sp. SS GN=BGS_0589 PE=3 SV=1: Pkinase [Gemmataceae bacterium]